MYSVSLKIVPIYKVVTFKKFLHYFTHCTSSSNKTKKNDPLQQYSKIINMMPKIYISLKKTNL